jgi:hypothetical protein
MLYNSSATHIFATLLNIDHGGTLSHAISLLALLLLSFVAWPILESKRKAPYPPGPDRLPLLGNLHNFPKKDLFRVLSEWKYIYGALCFLLSNSWTKQVTLMTYT